MRPLFSIIMPTFNRAYVIWRAIQSVIDQTETRWELIVVDDGSTDCTLRLIEEFQDPRIRVMSIDNHGPSYARNRGVEQAIAPYVAYLDSDNTWHTNYLERMFQAITEYDRCVFWACGQHTVLWERSGDGVWKKIFEDSGTRQPITKERIWKLKGVDTNCMVHRREVAETVGGWDEECRWIEDWDFSLRIFLEYPDRLCTIPDVLVEYRQVHGTGADGLCAEAREDKAVEVARRRYLLDKWGDHPDFAAKDKLSMTVDELNLMRGET